MKYILPVSLGFLCLLVIVALIKEDRLNGITNAKPVTNQALVKKSVVGEVYLMLIPSPAYSNFITMRLTLARYAPIKISDSRYMNFGIQRTIMAIHGADTVSAEVFERIPEVNKNIYTYICGFSKTILANRLNKDLRISIADSIAGFGRIIFDIKDNILKYGYAQK